MKVESYYEGSKKYEELKTIVQNYLAKYPVQEDVVVDYEPKEERLSSSLYVGYSKFF